MQKMQLKQEIALHFVNYRPQCKQLLLFGAIDKYCLHFRRMLMNVRDHNNIRAWRLKVSEKKWQIGPENGFKYSLDFYFHFFFSIAMNGSTLFMALLV